MQFPRGALLDIAVLVLVADLIPISIGLEVRPSAFDVPRAQAVRGRLDLALLDIPDIKLL